MALSENTPQAVESGGINEIPVAATKHIYEGAAVTINSSGYANRLAVTEKFAGHAFEEADNTSGANGDIRVKVRTGRYRMEVALPSVAITDYNAQVYMTDDGTYTKTSTDALYVGRVVRYVSPGRAVVEFQTTSSNAA